MRRVKCLSLDLIRSLCEDLVSLHNINSIQLGFLTLSYIASHCIKKPTIHQQTTMLATSKNVLFPGHNHLVLVTGHFDYRLSTSIYYTLANYSLSIKGSRTSHCRNWELNSTPVCSKAIVHKLKYVKIIIKFYSSTGVCLYKIGLHLHAIQ